MTRRGHSRLGIGITTFNRLGRLQQVLAAISEDAGLECSLIVVDDGSSDGTSSWLRSSHVPHITAPNRGIAWNKNRALAHLVLLDQCSEVVLLEDDTVPAKPGWEKIWIEAARVYGHMNYCGPWIRSLMEEGEGTISNPYISGVFSGQCVAFSRSAILDVGFMDTRFGRYGYEHVEHTQRLLKAGYGGSIAATKYYLIESDLSVFEGGVSRFESALPEAARIYQEVQKDESMFRFPYRSARERSLFLSELMSSQLYSARRKAFSLANLAALFLKTSSFSLS